MVDKVPLILGAEHAQPCYMTACDQLPAATDEQALKMSSPMNAVTSTFATKSTIDFSSCHCSYFPVNALLHP